MSAARWTAAASTAAALRTSAFSAASAWAARKAALASRAPAQWPNGNARAAPTTAPGMAHAGHDFALTRNRHGVGFWDGDWPVYGDLLTKLAHSFGEIELYVSDEGEIEC